MGVRSRVGKIPWRRKWQPTPVFLPGKLHRRGRPVGYSPWSHRVRHDWATEHEARTRYWFHSTIWIQRFKRVHDKNSFMQTPSHGLPTLEPTNTYTNSILRNVQFMSVLRPYTWSASSGRKTEKYIQLGLLIPRAQRWRDIEKWGCKGQNWGDFC